MPIDGFYRIEDILNAIEPAFSSEKQLCDYIETHIIEFCGDFLEEEYLSHEREKQLINTARNRIKGNRRLDFYIKTKAGKHIVIECKHPKCISELSWAIGQCMTYKTLLNNLRIPCDRMILISTKLDAITPQVIHDYAIPIEFMAMDKSKFVKFSHYGTTNRI